LGGLTIEGQVFAEITDASGLGAAYKAGHFDGKSQSSMTQNGNDYQSLSHFEHYFSNLFVE
jgi:hypothetical protein